MTNVLAKRSFTWIQHVGLVKANRDSDFYNVEEHVGLFLCLMVDRKRFTITVYFLNFILLLFFPVLLES